MTTTARPVPSRPVLTFSGSIPKDGNGEAECEDRFSTNGGRFAVADGVSEGCYSRVWAGILANRFCRPATGGIDDAGLRSWLDECRTEWDRWAETLSLRELPWFTRQMLGAGSFATFVGLVFSEEREESDAATWSAVACGDACVFVVRDNHLALAFPLSDSTHFDNSPALVPTSRALHAQALHTATGTVEPGDRFYLVTDALAQWFLASSEMGAKPWASLDRAGTAPHEFAEFVSQSRDSGLLRNDDVTLVSILVASDE